MSYVLMKVLEGAPARYDRGMRLLTAGRLERVHQEIAAHLQPGDRVLDIGCGTGALALLLARRGCQVTGIDVSPEMLALAGQKLRQAGFVGQVSLLEMGAVELDDAFSASSFDAVTASLVFSELSRDEIDYTLAACRRLLRPGGRLLVADEVLPDSILGRLGTFLLRLPFVVLAYLLAQTTTRRVSGLEERLSAAGYEPREVACYLGGTLRLYQAVAASAVAEGSI